MLKSLLRRAQQSPVNLVALEVHQVAILALDPYLDARRLGAGGRALAGCAVWGGGATPAQALYMVGLILPPKTAA